MTPRASPRRVPARRLLIPLAALLALLVGWIGLAPADGLDPGPLDPGAASTGALDPGDPDPRLLAPRLLAPRFLDWDGLEPGGSARVTAVVDGDTLVLADGRQVRLVGIQAPKLPLGRPNFPTWPLAAAAKAALAELAAGREVTLGYGGARVDRHGRALAQLRLDGAAGPVWLQGEMLARGLARVYSFPDNRALVAEMLALEAAARVAGRGIWADPWYRILSAEELAREPERWRDSFQIVEGRVLDAAVVKKRAYLNFGADWKTDFTVALDPAALRLFEAAGQAAESFEGRRIRVRGWLNSFNGPMIDATHPEQIEVLTE